MNSPTPSGDQPRFSLCGLAFPDTTLEQDIEIAREIGAEGLGIDERKLGDRDPEWAAELLAAAGLSATICVPEVMSFLPGPHMQDPADPEERIQAVTRGIERLSKLDPAAVFCISGPLGDLSPEEARRITVEGLKRAHAAAEDAGVPLCFEPFRRVEPNDWSHVYGIEDALEILDDADASDVGICYDVWHLWDSSDEIVELTRRHANRVSGVQLSDYREPTRSWQDRVLPGDGVIDLPALLKALREGGFDGWYDLEVFSDDGRFGDDYPDSVWKLPPVEIARRGRQGFLDAWAKSFD